MNDIVSRMQSQKEPEAWRPPSELAKSLPRDVAYTWRGIVAIVASVLPIGIAIWVYWFIAHMDQFQRAYRGGLHAAPPELVPYIALVAGLIAPIMIWVRIARQRSLLANGRVAQGRLLKVGWTPANHNGGHYKASYEFALPGGATVAGKTYGHRSRFGSDGDTVAVVYDPDNPSRSDIYPMLFVKVAEF